MVTEASVNAFARKSITLRLPRTPVFAADGPVFPRRRVFTVARVESGAVVREAAVAKAAQQTVRTTARVPTDELFWWSGAGRDRRRLLDRRSLEKLGRREKTWRTKSYIHENAQETRKDRRQGNIKKQSDMQFHEKSTARNGN